MSERQCEVHTRDGVHIFHRNAAVWLFLGGWDGLRHGGHRRGPVFHIMVHLKSNPTSRAQNLWYTLVSVGMHGKALFGRRQKIGHKEERPAWRSGMTGGYLSKMS